MLINGRLNSSLHHTPVCQGQPAKLNLYVDNEGLEKYIEGFILCGENWLYKFKQGMDFSKQMNTLQFVSADGYQLSMDSPYTMEIKNGKIRVNVNSSVYIGQKYHYLVYRTFDFSSNEIIDRARAERVSDGEIVATSLFELSRLPKLRILLDLPTIKNGLHLDIGFEFDRIDYSVMDTRALLMMDLIKRGIEFHYSSEPGVILPLIVNGSIHGLIHNKSAILDLNIQSDSKGFDQLGVFVRTPVDDEFKFKLTKSSEDDEKENSKSGELSLLCSVHPGIPRVNFTGFLYKTQISWTFDENTLKVEQSGEWNGNKATPPGMPFRFGIKRTFIPESGNGEIQIFAEDTSMGKAFGFEMIEVLYMYEMADPIKDSFQLESNILLNWRKYLGRGVVGSQATLKAQLDKSEKEGTAELTWTLPDDEQTLVSAELEYKIAENELTIKSTASLGEEKILEGTLEAERNDDAWEFEVESKVYDIEVEFDYEGHFTSAPSIDMKIKAKKGKKKLLDAKVVFADDKHPILRLLFAPFNNTLNLEQIDFELSSDVAPHEMTLGNFNLQGFFETKPIFKNFEFEVKTEDDSRLIGVSLQVTDPSGLKHIGNCSFELGNDGSELVLSANFESFYLSNGPIKVFVKHDCSSDTGKDNIYDLKCSKPNNYTLSVKNNQKSDRPFRILIAALNRISAGTTLAEVMLDNKHALRLISTQHDRSSGEVKLTLQINNHTIGELEGYGSLTKNAEGFKIKMSMKLTTDNSVIVSTKLDLSSMPRSRAIDLLLESSTEALGEHNFALKADAGYLLNLLLSGNQNQGYTQLKTYLLQLDDHVVGLEFLSSSVAMVTCSMPSLPVPAVFRMAYDIEKSNGWRALFQVNEPVQFEARTHLGSKEDIFLALSNKVNILDSVSDLRLSNLLHGEKVRFIKGGCPKGVDDCISIVLGGDARENSYLQLLFSLVLPKFGHIDSLVLETTFSGRTPVSLYLLTKGREIGFAASVDQQLAKISTEIAWNRQSGGLLKIIIGKNFYALQNHKSRVEIGNAERTYYVKTINLQSGEVCKYLECVRQGENQMKVDSYLLVVGSN